MKQYLGPGLEMLAGRRNAFNSHWSCPVGQKANNVAGRGRFRPALKNFNWLFLSRRGGIGALKSRQ